MPSLKKVYKKGLNKNNNKLTRDVIRQKLFVKEFLIDFNARRSAIAAGYSAKTADKNAQQILGNVGVHNAIASALQERSFILDMKAEDVVRELIKIYRRCMQEVEIIDIYGQPTGVWKFDAKNALKALELIGRHLMMFPSSKQSYDPQPSFSPAKVVFYIPENGRKVEVPR